MIALDREIPKTCFNCPCFATYTIDKENIPNIQYLIRFCEAAKQELVVLEWDKSETIPDVWMNFSKPNWCPWIDVGNGGLKWTMTFPDDCDDEERWHHNMAGFGGDY